MYSKDEFVLPEEVVVSGIFDMGMRDFDAGFILCSLETARELAGMESGVHAIYVMTADALKFDKFSLHIANLLGNKYTVMSWKDIDKLLFSALSHEKTLMFILLLFITIVAIFCVTNTLIVMGVQKTQEIGLLKALGFPPYQIMLAFILHGWMQCFLGSVTGLITGLIILNNLKRIVNWLCSINIEVFPKGIYGLSEIPWRISSAEITFVIVTVMFFCTLASLIPAWRAARLDPARALRHE
jgi:lipoprotein-releasing system permease protein